MKKLKKMKIKHKLYYKKYFKYFNKQHSQQILLSLYNYTGKYMTSYSSKEMFILFYIRKDAFYDINEIFGFELIQSEQKKYQFVRNTLSDPTWSHNEIIDLMRNNGNNNINSSILNVLIYLYRIMNYQKWVNLHL